MKIQRFSIVGTLLCIAALFSGSAHGGPGLPVELDIIVKDGDPAPAGDGNFDLSFGVNGNPALVIDNDAKVYFFATSTSFKRGVWSGTGAFVDDIAVDGQVIFFFQPTEEECEGVGSICGQIFNTSERFYVTPSGELLVRVNRDSNPGRIAHLAGTSNADLAPLLTDGQVANFPFEVGLKTESGQYLVGTFEGTKAFGDPDGGLEDFAAALVGGAPPLINDPVTVTEVIGTYGTSDGVTMGFNERGDKLFVAELSDGGQVIYFDPLAGGGSLNLLGRTGDTPPGIPFAAFTGFTFAISGGSTGNARINDAGQGYFVASWRDPDGGDGNDNLPRRGIWRFDNAGAPLLVMSEYLDPTQDPVFMTSEFANTAFKDFSSPQVAPNGDVYFYANGRATRDAGIPDTTDERVGLWRFSIADQTLELILRVTTSDAPGSSLPEGPNVPGTPLPGGGNFTGFGLSSYGIDEHGHLVFTTFDGIYAEDLAGLRLVLKKGQAIEIAPDDTRTVSNFQISNLGLVGDTLMGYRNDRLALRVRFADGSNAILRTRFPPPPVPPKLVALEAVQVVQDWNNSVPLYAGKPTLVRAHLRSDDVFNSEIVLRVFDEVGFELPFSPMAVESPGGLYQSGPEGGTKKLRRQLAGSANWTIPLVVLSDTLTVRVENLSGDLDCGTIPACSLELVFQSPPKPELRIVAVDWFDANLGRLRQLDRFARLELVDRLISAFPVSEVKWDDRQVVWAGFPDIEAVLPYTRRLRALDKCSEASGCRRMYYAAIPFHSLAGVAYLDGYAGTGYVHPNPLAEGRHTHSHEIGHNLDRHHSVADSLGLDSDGDKQGPCGSTAAADKVDFPELFNLTGLKARMGQHPSLRQALGPLLDGDEKLIYGFDSIQERVVSAFAYFDLMGYCSSSIIDMWPSAHTYAELATKLGQRYPLMKRFEPKGVAQNYVLVSGAIDPDSGAVELFPIDRIPDTQLPDGSPVGPWEVRLLDSGGVMLASAGFEPEITHARGVDRDFVNFTVPVPDPGGIAAVEVRDDQGATAAMLMASAAVPTVIVTSPNGGETLAGDEVTVEWTSSDADADPLRHTVQFSDDAGATWTTLQLDWPEQTLTVPRNILPATIAGLFRVIASDGFHQSQDDSDGVFAVGNSGPIVAILEPQNGRLLLAGGTLTLRASAYDTEDGVLGDAAVAWSSDIDGALGTGLMLQVDAASLTPGAHQLTATATDGADDTGSATVSVTVSDTRPQTLVDVGLLLTDLSDLKRAEEPHGLTLLVENAGPDAVSDLVVQVLLEISGIVGAKGAAGEIISVSAPEGWACSVSGVMVTCSAPDFAPLAEAEVVLTVEVAQPSSVIGTATFVTSATDAAAGNDQSTVDYLVGESDRVFADGFETLTQ